MSATVHTGLPVELGSYYSLELKFIKTEFLFEFSTLKAHRWCSVMRFSILISSPFTTGTADEGDRCEECASEAASEKC